MEVIAVKIPQEPYAQHSTPARYAMIPAKDTINRKAISWSARIVEIPLPWIDQEKSPGMRSMVDPG